MEVGKINNTQNFGARIRIEKTGFQNLGKDIADSFISGTNTTGTVASTIGESTAFPSELVAGVGFAKSINKGFNRIKNAINRIFGRSLKSSEYDADSHLLLNSSTKASSGSGMISTGLGSYTSSIASGLDQSVNYPWAGSEIVPKLILKSNNPIVNEVANDLEGVAFDVLYREHGLGNENASIPSAITSTTGFLSQGFGFDAIKNSNKAIKATRNFPS